MNKSSRKIIDLTTYPQNFRDIDAQMLTTFSSKFFCRNSSTNMNLVLSHVLEFSINLKYQFCIASFFSLSLLYKKKKIWRRKEGRKEKDEEREG